MHPDDFDKYAEELKKKAGQDASEENEKDYYKLQEIVRTKVPAFTNSA